MVSFVVGQYPPAPPGVPHQPPPPGHMQPHTSNLFPPQLIPFGINNPNQPPPGHMQPHLSQHASFTNNSFMNQPQSPLQNKKPAQPPPPSSAQRKKKKKKKKKKNEEDQENKYYGKIIKWIRKRRFGFIESPQLENNIFIHQNNILGGQSGKKNMSIKFKIRPGKKGTEAYDAVILDNN